MSHIIFGCLRIIRCLIREDHLHILYWSMLCCRQLRSLTWSQQCWIEDFGSLGFSIGSCSILSGFYFLGAPTHNLPQGQFWWQCYRHFWRSTFSIRSSNSKLVAANGSHLFSPIPATELWVTWTGIVYARHILQADCLVIEGDSFIVMDCI